MHEQEERKPSFLLSLVTFLGIACIIGYGLLGLGLDAHIPIAVAATFAALVGKIFVKIRWEKMESSVFAAITSSLGALLILISIGLLVGSWVLAGVVPGMIYYGLNLLSPGIFLLATLLLCSIVSLATGSSWGVGGTVGVALIGIATLVYHKVEGWRLLDALYFSVMTLATVGYGDFAPRTDAGKLFTIGFVFSGIGLFVATASALGDRIVAQRKRGEGTEE